MSYIEPPKPDYSKYNTSKLLSLPLALLAVSVLIILAWFFMTGAPVDRGMVFTGGTEVRISVDSSVDNPEAQIRNSFSEEPETLTRVTGTGSYIVQFSEGSISADEIEESVGSVDGIQLSELSQLTASLGDDAQTTAIYGMLIAFFLMSVLVILMFRSLIPAVVIILSAVSNIIIGVAMMNLFGIQMTMGTVGALLMLIGYSIDSDILLNSYVIRDDRSNFIDSVHEAMGTGLTMTVTSLFAMVAMTITATIGGIGLLADMGFLLAVGLGADIINTYLMNVSILRWYTTRGDRQ